MSWKDNFPEENRYFETDNGILYCGDCLEIVSKLPSLDLCLTSPPFLDKEVPDSYYVWLDKFLELIKQKVEVLLMFNSSLRLIDIVKRWDWRFVLMWNKPFTLPAYKYEPIFLWTKDVERKIWGRGRIYRTVLSYNVPRNKLHINENPVDLYMELLKFFSDGKLVIDPFMGSGTTAVACEKSNRRWIGIEINPESCEIVKQRILNLKGDKQ